MYSSKDVDILFDFLLGRDLPWRRPAPARSYTSSIHADRQSKMEFHVEQRLIFSIPLRSVLGTSERARAAPYPCRLDRVTSIFPSSFPFPLPFTPCRSRLQWKALWARHGRQRSVDRAARRSHNFLRACGPVLT